jgi:hypothetical protein
MTLWRYLIAILTWLSADPQAADLEHPKAAAAVSVARASMTPAAPAPTPTPTPTPQDCHCGATCRNGVWKPDGRVEQICRCPCERCKRSRSAGRVGEDCRGGSCKPGSSAGR